MTPSRAHAPGPGDIDAFLSSLDPWGILHLRRQLHSGKHAVEGLAELADLPPEIICQIIPLLRLADILNCLLVSYGWHRAWSHNAVMGSLCRHFFSGLIEIHPDEPDHARLFLEAARKRLQRQHVRPKLWTIHRNTASTTDFLPISENESSLLTAQDQSPDPGLKDIVRYSNGKVAWQPSKSQVIIDDLRTKRRQRCYFGSTLLSGPHLELQVLSSKLLVLLPSRGELSPQKSKM